MSNADHEHNEPSSTPSASENVKFWAQAIFLILLFLACIYSPWIITARCGHLWGLGASVGAFLLWAFVGPRPFPGFLPGIMATTVLLSSVFCALVSMVSLIVGVLHHAH
jgi:hypothetical protein